MDIVCFRLYGRDTTGVTEKRGGLSDRYIVYTMFSDLLPFKK